LAGGKLVRPAVNWPAVLLNAAELARVHAAASGCRSLDVLHCALADTVGVEGFVSTDARQITVATAMGLNVIAI
jgi:hypothetical protein